MKIKDNELLRQFEMITKTGLVTIEYAIQEKKLFLTKFCENENVDLAVQDEFITSVLEIAKERNFKVVPTHSKLVKFFRANKRYCELLPPGIKI